MESLTTRNAVSHLLRTATSTLLCAVTVTVSAQSTIWTEHPGLLISPTLLPEHMTQIEAGLPNFVFTRDAGADSTAHSFPTLIPYGITSNA